MYLTISVPFILQLFTSLLYWAMAIYAIKHRDTPGSRPYGWLLLALGWNAILFGAEQLVQDMNVRAVMRQAGWFGIATFGVLHLIFALQYTTQWDRLPPWFKKGLWAFPIILMLVNVTNPYHHLFFSSYRLEGSFHTFAFIGGPVRMVGITVNVVLLFAGLILLGLTARSAKGMDRRRFALLIAALAFPLLVNIVHVLGVLPADLASLAYAPSAILVLFVLTRYNLLDIAAIAQKSLIENIPDGVLVLTENGKVAAANPVLMKWLGLTGQVIGQHADSIFRALPDFYGAIFQALNERVEYLLAREQTQLLLALNSTRLLDRRGRDVGLLVQIRDITSQKNNEEKLRNSEANLWRIFDANPFALAISRIEDSRILIFNRACSSLFGFQDRLSENLYAKDFYSNPTDRALLMEDITRKGSIHNHQIEMITLQGNVITVLANLIPIEYNGEHCLLIGLVDLTERLIVEQALVDQGRKIAVMQERELMARELHDTLGQVLAFVGLQTNKTLELIDNNQISTAAVHLARLNTVVENANMDMRDYILTLKDQDTSSKGFVPALTDYLNRFSEVTGIQTRLSLPDGQAEEFLTPANEVQLLRVIQEALNNIRKHSLATSAQVIFIQNDNSLQLVISDNGIGFQAEQLLLDSSKVKENLSASPDNLPVHLGLQIMQDRVQSMHGTIKIHSAPGQGTQLIIYLSRKADSSLQVLRGLKFLLADDHGLILEGMTHLLEDQEIQVVGIARNGQEAVDQAFALQPDVILMDMQMPELSGTEALRQIREKLPDVKVIILTISASANDLESALENGADGYLLKNLTSSQFLRYIVNAVMGEFVIDPSMVSKLVGLRNKQTGEPTSGNTPDEKLRQLSERQLDILKLAAEGKLYKEIALALKISEAGVKYHMDQILGRLGVSGRAEAVSLAYKAGLAPNRRSRA